MLDRAGILGETLSRRAVAIYFRGWVVGEEMGRRSPYVDRGVVIVGIFLGGRR